MIYILDTGNIKDIKHCNEYYPIAGVTTNPSIIAKEKTDFLQFIHDVRSIIGDDKMLHIQTVQKTADKIVEEAEKIRKIAGGNFYVKVPISEEGLKATMELKKRGIDVTMTAIFTSVQAVMAARAGAKFVAPYVDRLDNIVANGTKVVAEIVDQLAMNKLDCSVLAASFKNAEQVHRCAAVGCHSVTVSPEILKVLVNHPMTDAAIAGFDKDWAEVYGDKTILDF